jgi:hypothetical protein
VPYYIYNNECGINRFYYPEYMFKDNEWEVFWNKFKGDLKWKIIK